MDSEAEVTLLDQKFCRRGGKKRRERKGSRRDKEK